MILAVLDPASYSLSIYAIPTLVISIKCHEAQGFLLSRPVLAQEAGKLLKGEKLYRIHADN